MKRFCRLLSLLGAYNIEVAKYSNNKIPISKLYKVIDKLNLTMPTEEFNKATYLLGSN